MAATVDVISEGRLEMGIGAGWYEHEWRAYGYGFPGAGERLARLREGVEIMQQMWTTGTATLDGEHYQVDGAMCFPRPLQGTAFEGSERNGIPMWVAGGGERKTLRIAAEYADYTNFLGQPDVFAHKSGILKQHCADVGRDYDSIVRSSNFNVVIGRDEREVEERFRWIESHLRGAGVPDEAVERSMNDYRKGTAVGTPDQVASALADMQDLGMTYAITNFAESAYDLSGVEPLRARGHPGAALTRARPGLGEDGRVEDTRGGGGRGWSSGEALDERQCRRAPRRRRGAGDRRRPGERVRRRVRRTLRQPDCPDDGDVTDERPTSTDADPAATHRR